MSSLFPSIPVDIALDQLKKHLNESTIENEKKEIYYKLAKMCMEQSYFQFREKIYKVEVGTNMGNPLSPLIAELFMAKFEMDLKEKGLLPRIWFRYVDDVFAVIKKCDIQTMLNVLNSQFETIKFTHETEVNGILPFLDLEVQRVNNKLEIGVYHKPTSTMRTITSDSHCPIQHKQAAYHSLIHRLCRLPLSIANYKKEYEHIMETARVNGYSAKMVDNFIYKHSRKVNNSNQTTMFSQRDEPTRKRVSIQFIPSITNKLKSVFKQHGFELVYRNDSKLSNLFGSTKDKTPNMEKSGIYCYECSVCLRKYYGQTKRSIETRFKDHCACIRLNHPYKSAIASHVLIDGHENINKENLCLLRQVNDDRRLDAYEAFHIQKDDNPLNLDRGNVDSCLFALAN